MKLHPAWLTAISLFASFPTMAQEAVNLDAVDPPKAERKAGDGIKMGEIRFNLWFDGSFYLTRYTSDSTRNSSGFFQEHASLLARATTPDDIEVYANVTDPGEVFEGSIPFAFFWDGLKAAPGIGRGSVRFGRIRVPFGDFEEHPIYGGTVTNSMRILGSPDWSDYGASVRLVFGSLVQAEIYSVDGIRTNAFDSTVEFLPTMDIHADRYPRGYGAKVRIDPVAGVFVTASYFHDFLPIADDSMERFLKDRAILVGLDAGLRTGPVSWRAGGALASIRASCIRSYSKMGWYAESKWSLNDRWALRLRGGQIDPDSRFDDGSDQTNVNLAAIWTKGPVDLRFAVQRNTETHQFLKRVPGDYTRFLLETFLNI